MAYYRYVKKNQKGLKLRRHNLSKYVTPVSFIAAGVGLVMITISIGPIVFYEVFTSRRFREAELLSPVGVDVRSVLGVNTLGQGPDLTRTDQWFPTVDYKRELPTRVSSYILAVPKLGIERGLVRIGGEDLSKSLIHFGKTALPGERGTGLIIGHSSLPQLFNQENYLTIFSNLPRLKLGDLFYVYYDGVQYRYRVEDMKETGPDDLSVLEQKTDDSYITLLTCVPPGLKTRRLAVRGRLVKESP
ncbi:MAG: Sortase SrtB [Microgenomates group bacterium GW2011_GWA2_44_7]|nr:MAG: Sortase SrtB [Microgenomates group bacterium GW2011_GWA2_44_7]KKT78636.1 MAG: Sortase SrtB [Microgenomates group bacterium GW2011_GWB1_44_8]